MGIYYARNVPVEAGSIEDVRALALLLIEQRKKGASVQDLRSSAEMLLDRYVQYREVAALLRLEGDL